MQHNTGCKTVHALCELHLHWFRDKLLNDIDYVLVSKATYYNSVRKSIQTMYCISKSIFKLMKHIEIYKKYHYKIVLSSLSWIQINYSTTHKYQPINDETYE